MESLAALCFANIMDVPRGLAATHCAISAFAPSGSLASWRVAGFANGAAACAAERRHDGGAAQQLEAYSDDHDDVCCFVRVHFARQTAKVGLAVPVRTF